MMLSSPNWNHIKCFIKNVFSKKQIYQFKKWTTRFLQWGAPSKVYIKMNSQWISMFSHTRRTSTPPLQSTENVKNTNCHHNVTPSQWKDAGDEAEMSEPLSTATTTSLLRHISQDDLDRFQITQDQLQNEPKRPSKGPSTHHPKS